MSTLGLGAARALDPARFAIGGVVPRVALRPVAREEVAEALRAATRDGLGVVPWGGGVSLPRLAAPPRYDVALELTALDRIVEHEPEDFTLTAECGVTLATLRAQLAARGQELPLESAVAARATLGGVIAADASGPRRLRFGAPHDRILGAHFALGDGTLARTGGRVVKNVAGYAVHRLLCGARGGLAVLLEASLKLSPAPLARRALVWPLDAAALADAARWAWAPRLEPALVTVLGRAAASGLPELAGAGAFAVVIAFEDEAVWVERQAAAARERLGPEARAIEGAEVVALTQALADLEETQRARLTFATADNTPAALAPIVGSAEAAHAVFHAPAGRLHLFPEPARAQALVGTLAAAGFTLTAAVGAGEVVPALPPQVAVSELRARVRAALDPAGTLVLGARWGAV